ncbi:MAG: AAA family ATPase [Candidatus Paceibacterota bacterium]
MWIEKYRPHKFEDVQGLDPELPKLVNDDMPHLMFVGKAGSGKTTTARIIVDVLGCDCLRLNASDERGIDVIRDKVKDYARTRSSNGKFKIVFLDEADFLTKEAQMILRGVIEAYHTNCRFILTGNYITKFDDAIKSRCKQFSFNTQSNEQVAAYLDKICCNENVCATRDALEKLAAKYNPDIRTMLNELETLAKKGTKIMPSMISEEDDRVAELVKLLQSGQMSKAKKWILDSSFDIHYVLNLLNTYSWNAAWDTPKKLKFWEALGETEFRMGLSVDEEVQLSSGLVRMYKALM